MRPLEKRLSALEARARSIPTRIDDSTILDVVGRHRVNQSVIRPALERLFDIVRPAAFASLTKGTNAIEYCQTRGVKRPGPSGPMSLLAEINLYSSVREVPESLIRPLLALKSEVETWLVQTDIDGSTSLSPKQVRSYLVIQLAEHRSEMGRGYHRARAPVPTWTKSEADRALRLVESIESTCDDLPLLVWKDSNDGVHSSSRRGSKAWTPVDVGLDKPGYLLLSGGESGESTSGTDPVPARSSPLTRCIPALGDPGMSDDEVVAELTSRNSRFVHGSPTGLDALFLRIEPYLLGSVLIGARSLRIARHLNISMPTPQTAVAQAATVVSYETTADMPPELVEATGRVLPGAERYDQGGVGLTSFRHCVGTVRGALVFRLLEKHGVAALRKWNLADADFPQPTDGEVQALRKLIKPISWNPDPDLPLLVWRSSDGSLQTSSDRITGQIRSVADINAQDPGSLLLPDREAMEMIPEPDLFAADHYRPWGR